MEVGGDRRIGGRLVAGWRKLVARPRRSRAARFAAILGVEAEVTERVQQQGAKRHAVELARMSQQHVDDLQRARSSAVDSFKALTSSILRSV